MFAGRLVRDFAFGMFYLVSGLYSVGLASFFLARVTPVSGSIAYVMSPDPLFPMEIMTFTIFGTLFLAASVIEFRKTLLYSGEPIVLKRL